MLLSDLSFAADELLSVLFYLPPPEQAVAIIATDKNNDINIFFLNIFIPPEHYNILLMEHIFTQKYIIK